MYCKGKLKIPNEESTDYPDRLELHPSSCYLFSNSHLTSPFRSRIIGESYYHKDDDTVTIRYV